MPAGKGTREERVKDKLDAALIPPAKVSKRDQGFVKSKGGSRPKGGAEDDAYVNYVEGRTGKNKRGRMSSMVPGDRRTGA